MKNQRGPKIRIDPTFSAEAIVRGLLIVFAIAGGGAAAAAQVAARVGTLQSLVPNARPARSCESLRALSLPSTTIDSAAVQNVSLQGPRPQGARGPEGDGPQAAGTVTFCRVVLTVTHPPAGDEVRIWIGLPTEGWNGRFVGVGGGGFLGGRPDNIAGYASRGFAAGTTDTGHPGGSGSFALDAKGRLNWMLIRDNAYLGVHKMTLTGKALAEAFYGSGPRRAYWSGCSSGGRQGLSEAQRYPSDYDGILSGAPAINLPKFASAGMWATVVMLEQKHVVAPCKFAAATEAAVTACDTMDGLKDGLIEDPRRCTYDPRALVGTSVDCGTITEADASVIRAIWEGPRRRDGTALWYGLPRGAPFSALASTGGTPLEIQPPGLPLDWFRFFLKQDAQWDWRALDRAMYEQLRDQFVEQYGAMYSTDDPDLSAFRRRGGKVILWHGWADDRISPEGTIEYYRRVQEQMGGAKRTDEFARLFMAPGVGHCGGGVGPAPVEALGPLIEWVERGRAPEKLLTAGRDAAGSTTRARPLCPYPRLAKYRGQGSIDEAENFTCR